MRNTLAEVPVFLGCLCCGLVIGTLYCVFMPLHAFVKNTLIHGILDALFYCAALGASAFALLYLNGGVIRFYTLLGIGLGICIVLLSSGRLIRALMERLQKKQTKKRK